MIILPAIDLLCGKAVRLSRGDYDSVKQYSDDPESVLGSFISDGAKEVHIVDLDGAKAGSPVNHDLICRLAKKFTVEVGGGIRTLDIAQKYVDAGAARVIFGSAVAHDIGLAEKGVAALGTKFAAGVDAKCGKVAVSGWTKLTDIDSYDFCGQLAALGVSTVIYTDIDTDGMLSGTNMKAFEKLSKLNVNIIASGGISSVGEIRELAKLGIYGAIVGKAIYENKLTLASALEAAIC